MTTLRIGTRGSPLALWQANYVADRLRTLHPGLVVELLEIQTAGDRIRDVPLTSFAGEGVFTKAIQDALLDNRVDVAVHSLKDLPTVVVDNLTLGAIPQRAPTGDAFISKKHASFAALPPNAKVATSSLRRRAQLLHQRPDLHVLEIRGNVDTRLRKLVEQNLDATILAEAGLRRLGLEAHITEVLDASWMFPAVGQGALGIECRRDDATTNALLQPLNDPATRAAALAERAMLRTLGGGCHVPIGARGSVVGSELRLIGTVLAPDGSSRIIESIAGLAPDCETLGVELAEALKSQGAAALLQS
ncbi:MAG: hydroxymethylbilane synthase [Planctomycetota bacterium]